jgi:hypothetical protein
MKKYVVIETYKNIIRNYIRAKDDNKPHLMKAAFTGSATLAMKVNTSNISFPSNVIGLDEITDVLVRKFSQTYENVYTFCFVDSLDSQDGAMSCKWLVGMSERDGRGVRIGCGRYDWGFEDEKGQLASSLVITIEQMLIFSSEETNQLIEWIGNLPYPFCDSGVALDRMPDFESLDVIREYI